MSRNAENANSHNAGLLGWTCRGVLALACVASADEVAAKMPEVGFAVPSSSVGEPAGTLTVEVKLSAATRETVRVDFTAGGGTAYGAGFKTSTGPFFGSGQDYELAPGTLTFEPGAITQKITLALVNDAINEADETLEIRLANARGAVLGSYATHVCTILDDDRKLLKSVMDYGARGDGKTDDTAAVQHAIDAAHGAGGGVILFPQGIYEIVSVTLQEGVTCQGAAGAVIRRPPLQPKFTRTFTTAYSGATDSRPVIVKGLVFDGNCTNQGDYQKYELEQAHLVFLYGEPASPGRLRAFIEDCGFLNCVADGISVYTNVRATIFNCESRSIFRGGFVATGGHSEVEVINFRNLPGAGPNRRAVSIEVDGKGYQDDLALRLRMEGLDLADGDFYAQVKPGSVVTGRGIRCPRGEFFSFSGLGKATMKFSDCLFAVGGADGYNRIMHPGNLTFENCEFLVRRKEVSNKQLLDAASAKVNYFGIEIWWNHPTYPEAGLIYKDQAVTFKGCKFSADASILPSDTVHAVHTLYDDASNNNVLTVEGGTISKDFDVGLVMGDGGKWLVKDVSSEAGLLLQGPGAGRPSEIVLDGVTRNSRHGIAFDNDGAAHAFVLKNAVLDAKGNELRAPLGLEKSVFSGQRVIEGRGAPTAATHGLMNDIYRELDDAGRELGRWKCTKAGYLKGSALAEAQWQREETN